MKYGKARAIIESILNEALVDDPVMPGQGKAPSIVKGRRPTTPTRPRKPWDPRDPEYPYNYPINDPRNPDYTPVPPRQPPAPTQQRSLRSPFSKDPRDVNTPLTIPVNTNPLLPGNFTKPSRPVPPTMPKWPDIVSPPPRPSFTPSNLPVPTMPNRPDLTIPTPPGYRSSAKSSDGNQLNPNDFPPYDPWGIPDTDEDGIPDSLDKNDPNGMGDIDGDGLPDYADPIQDMPGEPTTDDGLQPDPNNPEDFEDWDGDGIPNWQDTEHNPPTPREPQTPTPRTDSLWLSRGDKIGTQGSQINPMHAGSASGYVGDPANGKNFSREIWKSAKTYGKGSGMQGGMKFGPKASAAQAYSNNATTSIAIGGANPGPGNEYIDESIVSRAAGILSDEASTKRIGKSR